jgi:hypothetical protein
MSGTDLQDALGGLQSAERGQRSAALHQLIELGDGGLSVAEGLQVIRAATQRFEVAFLDIPAQLIGAAAKNPQPGYIPVLVELYPRFGDAARREAIALLAKMGSRDAALAIMSILRTHGKAGGVSTLATGLLCSKPRHAEVFFPELLEYITVPTLEFDVNFTCLSYCQAGLLSTRDIAAVCQADVGCASKA